jgi:hypothetical protein
MTPSDWPEPAFDGCDASCWNRERFDESDSIGAKTLAKEFETSDMRQLSTKDWFIQWLINISGFHPFGKSISRRRDVHGCSCGAG